MDKNDAKYESLKQKLLKMAALAEQGYRGEAEAAKAAIKRLCAQYGVTLEEILAEQEETKRYQFEIGRNKCYLTLFVQCHGVVTNKSRMSYVQRTRSIIAVDLTPLQYAELCSLFEWHKANFNKDLQAMQETIVSAYVHKHHLFAAVDKDDPTEEDKPLTAKEFARLYAIIAMQDQLGDNKYHKMLEAAK